MIKSSSVVVRLPEGQIAVIALTCRPLLRALSALPAPRTRTDLVCCSSRVRSAVDHGLAEPQLVSTTGAGGDWFGSKCIGRREHWHVSVVSALGDLDTEYLGSAMRRTAQLLRPSVLKERGGQVRVTSPLLFEGSPTGEELIAEWTPSGRRQTCVQTCTEV